MGALPQLPFLLLKGLCRRISQVLGVELGMGPQTFCSGYSSWLAVALLCPRTLFSPQEEGFLACLVYPNCFFEVSSVWGRERCMQGWDITLYVLSYELLFGGVSLEHYLLVFLSCCFFVVGYSADGDKPTRGLFRVDFWSHWPVFSGTEDVGSDFWDGEAETPHFLSMSLLKNNFEILFIHHKTHSFKKKKKNFWPNLLLDQLKSLTQLYKNIVK